MAKITQRQAQAEQKKGVHPESREARRLARAVIRHDRIDKRRSETETKREVFLPYYHKYNIARVIAFHTILKATRHWVSNFSMGLGTRLEWFWQNLDKTKTVYTDAEYIEVIKKYIARNDVEIEYIKSMNKYGNRHKQAGLEDSLLTIRKIDEGLLQSGFEAPDATTEKNFRAVKAWDLSVQKMANVPLKIFKALKVAPKVTPATTTPTVSTTAVPAESTETKME